MSVESALVLCRFIHFTALFAWFGRLLFVCVVARPGITPRLASTLARESCGAACWLAGLTLLSACAWVPVQTAEMSGGWEEAWQPSLWLAVLDTPLGTVWRWHLLLAVVTTALASTEWLTRSARYRSNDAAHASTHLANTKDNGRAGVLHPSPTPVVPALTLVGTGALLVTLGLQGHAAMLGGWAGALQRTNHAVHLLSTAAWAGMLPMLLRTLSLLNGGHDQASKALRRFSSAGHIAVALAVATGVANIAWVVGNVPWNGAASSAPYRDGLMLKCVLVAAMIGIALVNRYGIVPALQRTATMSAAGDGSDIAAARLTRLRRAFCLLTWLEIGLSLVVIALVSHFATLDPR